jgi:membrane fusion protein (multidrug efflux system)
MDSSSHDAPPPAGDAPASAAPDERSRWQRFWEDRRRWIVGGGALLLVGIVALLLFGGGSNGAQASGAQSSSSGEGPDTVRTEGFVAEPIRLTDRIFTTGTLRANESVELTAEVSGKIERISFQEGDRVARGQLLVAFDTEDLQAERDQLQAELRVARRRAEREEKLLERGGVSEQDYEETASQVQVLQARIDRVEAQIEKHRIRAPFSGTVGLRDVSPGSYVSPGQRVAALRDVSPIKMDFSVPARYGRRLQAGDRIRFNVEGSERTYRAEVYAIEPGVREETRAVQIRARASNRDRALRPGAFAEVEVIFEELDDALVVPSIAVLPEAGRQRVFLADDGTAEARTVQTGIRTDSMVQITSGVQAQDTVLVSALQSLRPGASVAIDTLVRGGAGGSIGERAPASERSLPTGGG